MTCEEFSNEFDVMMDSYLRFKDFDDKDMRDSMDFNEYEKSVFLTKAQELTVMDIYRGSSLGNSFEGTEEITKYLYNIVKRDTLKNNHKSNSGNCLIYSLDDINDLWLIVMEELLINNEDDNECLNGEHSLMIKPTTHDRLIKELRNPFRSPNNRKALRVIENNGIRIYIDKKYKNIIDTSYTLVYIKKPKPIILIDLPEGVSIDNNSIKSECELDSSLHKTILLRAVDIAKSTWLSNKK